MKLVRRDPFGRELSALANTFNRFFEPRNWEEEAVDSWGSWHPPVDILDGDNEIVLVAELPGIKKKDIDIKVENSVMTLSGQRKREKETEKNGYSRRERSFGTFSRSFTLPTSVDVSKISASYTDGVLTVTLHKAEEAKPRQIDVKVA